MDLESCPEQISDKVFQDEHSALPGKPRGGWLVTGGEGGGAGEGAFESSSRRPPGRPPTRRCWEAQPAPCKWERQAPGDLRCELWGNQGLACRQQTEPPELSGSQLRVVQPSGHRRPGRMVSERPHRPTDRPWPPREGRGGERERHPPGPQGTCSAGAALAAPLQEEARDQGLRTHRGEGKRQATEPRVRLRSTTQVRG